MLNNADTGPDNGAPGLDDLQMVAFMRIAGPRGWARELRLAAGLSEQDVADVVGVSSASICRWETGKRTPRANMALRWAKVLDRIAGTVEVIQ